jgi:multidrug efflux pump subunit AcrA (membrane-fusion protein)
LETKPPMPPSDNLPLAEQPAALKNSFATHGSEIDAIISKRLPLVVRWGTVFFLFVLLGIAGICWLIKYPDIITANARLTGINTPKEIITRTDGRLQKIWVVEGAEVQKGQWVGSMESVADANTVLQTSQQLDTIATLIANNRTDEILRYFPALRPTFSADGQDGALGELQPAYQAFVQAFIAFKDFLSNGYFLRKKKMLQQDMQNLQQMQAALNTQKTLIGQDVDISTETFKANEQLYNQKVIAPFEYRGELSKLIGKQLTLPQAATAIIGNQSQQNEKRKEIAELENQIQVQKNTFIQALHTLQSQAQAWEYKYLLKAPVAGKLSFAGFYQENQEIKAGQALFYVQPENSTYFVEMLVPQYNFGKVQPGQQVLLKLAAYPYEQYGQLTGKIEYISNSPTDSGYLAKVALPDGLVTNFKKPLLFHHGLQAQADIVTQDMRLLQRFYYNMVKQLTR